MRKVIEAKDLSFTYNGSNERSIKNLNFDIYEEECIILCGISGCGKTTLTRIFNGLAPAFFQGKLEGSCTIFDLSAGTDPIEKFVPCVGSVFQNPKTQYFCTTTDEELAFPCENTGMPAAEIKERVEQTASACNIKDLMKRSIFHLSGGEKQKIAFAGAMMLKPKLLVLDEPTSNLDASSIAQLHDLVTQAKKDGMTIVIAEHRLAWTTDFADRYFYFEDGCLSSIYSLQEMKDMGDEELKTKGLRGLHNVKAIKPEAEGKDPYLLSKDLVIGYRDTEVLSLPHLAVRKGEILCIMGNNGIGKTTLIKTLCGLIKPLKGTIEIEGKQCHGSSLTKKSFLIMQDVNHQLFADSVEEEILLGSNMTDCTALMKEMNLLTLKERHPVTLSGGQKQRTVIASSILADKDILYFDEPTSGLDDFHMEKAGKILQNLKEMNKAVVVITHDEDLADRWCDRIIRLENTL